MVVSKVRVIRQLFANRALMGTFANVHRTKSAILTLLVVDQKEFVQVATVTARRMLLVLVANASILANPLVDQMPTARWLTESQIAVAL